MSSRSMRPTPSNASFASTSISHQSTTTSTSSSEASVSIFRHLNFVASIPIQFTLAPSSSSATTTGDSSSEIQTYFLQVPRISYLGLVLPTIQKEFLILVTGDREKEKEAMKQVWFQDEQTKEFLKPHWPIGLMYDYHHSTNHHSLPSQPPSSSSASENAAPDSLASVFAPFDSPSLLAPPSFSNEYHSMDSNQTLRGTPSSRASDRSASSSSHYQDRQSSPSAPSTSSASTRTILNPWKIVILLSPPPQSVSPTPQGISTNGSSTIQETKNQLMNRLKESDYLRFGNSKKRLVNLKKEEQDSLWYGIVHNDFTKFWAVGNKLIPLPSTSSNYSNTNLGHDDQTITQNGNGTGADGDLKNLAIKIYLPPIAGEVGGGKVLNSPSSPLDPRTGQPITLQSYLSTILPLLFPAPSYSTSTIRSAPSNSSSPKAFAIIQGIVIPLESQLSWLTSCLGGTDGWLSIVIAIRD
ncbi:hypothetical protein JCM3765_005192 [Sporobolomyces pararoseus]